VVEPRRDDENQIRAGFALNAWQLLKHYEELTRDEKSEQRYEATLTVSVLQSLLTNCWELYKYLGKRGPQMVGKLDGFVESLLADPEVTVVTKFPAEKLDAKCLVVHLRNALSHPRMKDTDPPTTGYTTVKDGSGLISRLRFVDSPEVNNRGTMRAEARERIGSEDLSQVYLFEIELPLTRLAGLAEEVAMVLAQPVMNNWDSADLVPLPR
jgi:hypothetical protein